MRLRATIFILLACTLAFGQEDNQLIEIRANDFVFWIYKEPLRFVLFNKAGEELTSQAKQIVPGEDEIQLSSIWYETSRRVHHLTKVLSIEDRQRQITAICATTEEGRTAEVRIQATRANALRLEISIMPGDGVLQTGDIWHAHPGEHFYGLETQINERGDSGPGSTISTDHLRRIESLDLRGWRLMGGTSVSQSVRSRKASVSGTFLTSSRRFGLWVDAQTWGDWDFSVNKEDEWVFGFDGSELTYELYAGRSLAEVLSQYAGATGGVMKPPIWAFGPLRIVTRDSNLADIEKDVVRNQRLPFSGYIVPELESPDMLERVSESLRPSGANVVVGWPIGKPAFDRKWLRAGLGGVSLTGIGSTLDEQQSQVENLTKELDPRDRNDFLFLSDTTYTGLAAHSAVLEANPIDSFKRLDEALVAMQRAALMGYPFWAGTIATWPGDDGPEAIDRALQAGAFFPLCTLTLSPQTSIDSQTSEMCERWAALRHVLQPYFFTLAGEAVEMGWPLIRPLVMSYSKDGRAGDRWNEFQLGDALLIVPITEPTHKTGTPITRTIFLPPSLWRPLWALQSRVNGGTMFEVEAAPDQIPIFIKEGSIVPLQSPAANHIEAVESVLGPLVLMGDPRLLLWIVPDKSGSATGALYDGMKLRDLSYETEMGEAILNLEKTTEPIALRIHTESPPAEVAVGSSDLPRLGLSELAAWDEGWAFDPDNHLLWVKLDAGARRIRMVYP